MQNFLTQKGEMLRVVFGHVETCLSRSTFAPNALAEETSEIQLVNTPYTLGWTVLNDALASPLQQVNWNLYFPNWMRGLHQAPWSQRNSSKSILSWRTSTVSVGPSPINGKFILLLRQSDRISEYSYSNYHTWKAVDLFLLMCILGRWLVPWISCLPQDRHIFP